MGSYCSTVTADIGSATVDTYRTYKTKIASVAPTRLRAHYATFDSAFLGVSLENDGFGAAKLQSMIRWLDRKFPRTALLIGDSIHRITLETVSEVPAEEALTTALRLGDEIAAVIEDVSGDTDTTVLRCSEMQNRVDYHLAYEQLSRLFDLDEPFRESVRSFSDRFQRRSAHAGIREADLDAKVLQSCRYFLEEFAVFTCLVADGFKVMAYPGAFSTLTEIAHGQHVDVPQHLKDLVVVSLDLKGRDRLTQHGH